MLTLIVTRFQDAFSQELISLILRPKTNSQRHTARYGIPLNIRGSGGWPPGGAFVIFWSMHRLFSQIAQWRICRARIFVMRNNASD